MPCMNSTSISASCGRLGLVDNGRVLLGSPGAPGCTRTGARTGVGAESGCWPSAGTGNRPGDAVPARSTPSSATTPVADSGLSLRGRRHNFNFLPYDFQYSYATTGDGLREALCDGEAPKRSCLNPECLPEKASASGSRRCTESPSARKALPASCEFPAYFISSSAAMVSTPSQRFLGRRFSLAACWLSS